MTTYINNYAASESDTEEIKFQKKLIFIVSTSCCLCGFLWSALCNYVYGWGLPSIFPLLFVVIVGSSLILGSILKSYLIPVYAQLSCITFITSFIQWSIGSLYDSGMVMTWAFLGPIGALLFLSRKEAIIWLIIFLMLILVTILGEPKIGSLIPLVNQNERILLYSMNLVFPLVLIFSASLYLLTTLKKLKQENEELLNKTKEKNKEILDSINYAKRIQSAILPPDKLIKTYLKESFVLYKPKDVVAGDFYWMEHQNGKTLFAACDCTGHGVPGAMVSVVCNNSLNRAVREYGILEPGKILDKTRELVITEFEKSEEDVKDGMDIALCCIEGNKLTYSGAHNSLWIIRQGELLEIKADKQPIGKFEFIKTFTTHIIELNKGDSIYIFSDGYPDQFGGEKGKKYKSIQLKNYLLSIQSHNMDKQKELLNSEFENWRKNLEQNDDVCVIGVRV